MKRVIGWLLLLLLLCGCGKTAEQPWTEPVFASAAEVWAVEAQETYDDAPGELAEVYESLEELAAAAEEIVRVSVLSVQEEKKFLVSDVRTAVSVLDAWKGDLRVGARVEILESGGAGSTVLGGIPRMALDRTYVLFLRQDGEQYRICGAIQGRFIECGGYLFQQTWESLKLPETPTRTGALENAVYRLQPHPDDDLLGPPWIWTFEQVSDMKEFIQAAETPETCERWIEEHARVHCGLLSDVRRAADIAADLKTVPIPILEQDQTVDVYPDYGRDYVQIEHLDGEKACRITIPMEADTVQAGNYGRPVEAENFQVLYDQTDVLLDTVDFQSYVGQVGGYPVIISLWGYGQEEGLTLVREMEFCQLGSMLE